MQQFQTIAFFAIMLLYLWMPYSMISGHQEVLNEGHVHLFRTRPVDPYDAFRGKYVALSIANTDIVVEDNAADFVHGQTVYASLGKDSLGYAFFKDIALNPPDHTDYLRAEISFVDQQRISLRVPDNLRRYYLNEKMAPLAEKAYIKLSRRSAPESNMAKAHLQTRVWKGEIQIEELLLDGQSVADYLQTISDQ